MSITPAAFTIRVYGLLLHEDQILLSRENIQGEIFTKFPGGGLEFGEGVIECLKREFMEEVGIEIYNSQHFYTTEDYWASAFHKNPKQVLSLYYKVFTKQLTQIKTDKPENNTLLNKNQNQILYWCPLTRLINEPIKLPIDKIVVQKLLDKKNPVSD
jgi:ADP-ribose pyrophosphatase YjhB (NUDIX family)